MGEKPRRSPARDTAPEISVEPLRYDAGDVVGEKVLLLELLGTGGMGTVWRARHIALDVEVAVKLLHGELITPEATERLQREAHAAARLEHPAAVRILDFGRTELGDSYIVMELLRGENLAELFDRRGPLDPGEAVALLLPIAGVLAAAHARGIVHRDLKPENVMLVDVEGLTVPKLVDFGIAAIDGPPAASGDDAIYGSPAYMSPEHARGDDAAIDARSDVWSLGVLVYEAIAGRPPFEADDPFEVLRRIAVGTFASLDELGRADADLSAIVSRALTKDRDARWPDMRSFGRALSQWATSQGIETDVMGGSIAVHWGQVSRAPPPPSARIPSRAPPPLPTEGASRVPPPLPPPDPSQLRKLLAARDQVAAPPSTEAATGSGRSWLVAAMAVAGVGLVVAVMQWRSSGNEAVADAPSTSAETARKPSLAPALSTRAAPAAASPSTSSPPPPALQTPAPAAHDPAAADTPACVTSLFPDDTFHAGTSFLGMCSERDAARGAQNLRVEIARHGLIAERTTEAMRLWSSLHWYEMPTFALVQARCCPASAAGPLTTPPPPPSCDALGPVLDGLARAVRAGADLDAATVAFRAAITCHETAVRRNPKSGETFVRYGSAADGGAETAFLKVARKAFGPR
jgi:serine/threonine protein kinase